ncbi:ATP-binding cassette sub-family A member 2-like isoform X2 [Polyodon spathula]|uniref:ATP-binding cassette sub-family A member 2-like isoform X2 n=1 Tax=Polyodon spathula TaxID=7913 RepID=UPI001B7E48D7|nr:ATP-binding cassette sub-family A member 2-like isoform X2 [Polyodon spathula]
MQSLCPDGQRDEFGFLQYSNSTVTQLLDRINEVVEQNNLFDPDRPGLEEELESLRHHLESLSTEPSSLENHLNNSHGFTLGSVLKDRDGFQQFLSRNLSLPNDTATLLLSSNVDLKEVYRLFFGSYPTSRGVDSVLGSKAWEGYGPGEKMLQLEEHLLGGWRNLEEGLIHKALSNPEKIAHRQALLRLLTQALGLTGAAAFGQGYDPQGLKEMENILLTAGVLELLTCGNDGRGSGESELRRILLVPDSQQALLQAYRSAVCSGGTGSRVQRFSELARELREQIDTQRVISKLKLQEVNSTAVQRHLGALLQDLSEVERILRDVDVLSALAKLLPKGACAGKQAPSPANTTAWSTNTTVTETTGWSNSSEGGNNDDGAGSTKEEETPPSQFSAFVQLWAGLQPILCGNNRIIEPEALKQGNMSSLGFTSKEQRNLGLLVHLMTTNPKILYSPVGSEADKVIQKANETFAFVGNVTHYARVWLNISAEIRTFLEERKLQNRILWLQQVGEKTGEGGP